MKHIVKSSDGVLFAVESADARNVAYDQAYAASQHSRVLEGNSDFSRLHDLGQLLGAPLASPEFVFEAPRISGPLERRAAFKVIQGGKP